MSLSLRAAALAGVLSLLQPFVSPGSAQGPGGEAVVLITLDGVRTSELFGGMDAAILQSTLAKGATLEDSPVFRRFNGATPAERREKLMPFFWRELMARHGSVAGNPALNSAVRLTNRHRFSYPGYSEILTGGADDEGIKSNDRIQNPHSTVLEGLRAALRLPKASVATFASWEVFNEIAERTPGTIVVNAGYEPLETGDAALRTLSALQMEARTPWNSARHDAFTFRLAMGYLQAERPRVLYLAFDETDDWAHDGRYDRVLETMALTDAYLQELWTWLQAQPDYRRVHLLITTDHGRGRTAADWRTHGAAVEGAQDVWMAFVSPTMTRRGEWRDHPPLFTSQAAATVAGWLGVEWRGEGSAGAPVK